ncbi:hypothetical protein [Thiomonas sp.]|jgi:hypothetical protein|uniref:hypothetical protein n=1 Tax=Thiomonas sp. TaxID=2047785 RepID=UPI002639D865|nr:hypothetical protein [Thiomonas sp.]
MRTYQSFGALARALTRASEALPAAYTAAMATGAQIVAEDARERIGSYQDGWPHLAPSTVAEKTRLGYAGVPLEGGDGGDNPLLRTGEMRDSIKTEATPRGFIVGSTDPVLGYQEFGTRTIPPRPVLGPALQHSLPAVGAVIGKAVVRTLKEA